MRTDRIIRLSGIEIAGVLILVPSVVGFVASLFVYAAGTEVVFFGSMVAFALGTTGIGMLAAGRNARERAAAAAPSTAGRPGSDGSASGPQPGDAAPVAS